MINKYALVTGGSRGIGRAICQQLGAMGYTVLINYRSNKAAALETLALLESSGSSGVLMPFDVANREAVKATLATWRDEHPGAVVEVLVNNAGMRSDALLPMMADEQWDSVLDTSLNGMYNVTRQLIAPMAMNRYGRIINIVSLSGLKGLPGQVNYAAAKAGVIGATRALAQEVAKRNITVNAIAPGFITTDMTEGLATADNLRLIPANRFGTPEEVAHLAAFLASTAAGYITGQVISINGGLF